MLNRKSLGYKDILDHVRTIRKENYGSDDINIIERVLWDVVDLFSGKRKGFQKCDTTYHDLLHTFQVILPFTGIIDGWNKNKNKPTISREFFDLGVIAVLLHDTGYIKTESDVEGTGAKYTFVHTQMSANFAENYLSQTGFEKNQISSVKNIIMCTGVKVDYEKIRFGSEEERIAGYALGTADLLGQMSASDYPEKLHALFSEFEEAYRYEGVEKLREGGLPIFENANDLIKKTPFFYEVAVAERFKRLGSMHKYLIYHFKDSRNHYIEAIEENIKKIKSAYLRQ